MGPIQSSMQGGSSSAESKGELENMMTGGGGFRSSPIVNISQGSSSLRASTSAAEEGKNTWLIVGGIAAAAVGLMLVLRKR